MILRAEQRFDKVYLDRGQPSDFIDYISYGVERELVDKVMDKLKDHNLYIVKLNEPGFIEDLPGSWQNQCAYRQDLACMEVVQCKNCRMVYPWCQRFRDELGGEGYCPYGKEIEIVREKSFNDGLNELVSVKIDDILKKCKDDIIDAAAERLTRTKKAKEILEDNRRFEKAYDYQPLTDYYNMTKEE